MAGEYDDEDERGEKLGRKACDGESLNGGDLRGAHATPIRLARFGKAKDGAPADAAGHGCGGLAVTHAPGFSARWLAFGKRHAEM